mgnify:CR=1 FL=1
MNLASYQCVGGIYHGRFVALPPGVSRFQCTASRIQPYEAWRGVWGLPMSQSPYCGMMYELRWNPNKAEPYLAWAGFA